MARILLLLLMFSCCHSIAWAKTPEEYGLEIVTEFDKRDTGFIDSTAEMEMILINTRGQESKRSLRTMSLEVDNEGEGERRILIFDAPRDIKGTVMLTSTQKLRTDDQWLYFPAIKRVKRIASNNKTGPFVGSEFAYEDMGSVEVEKYTYKYIKDSSCGENLNCFLVERYPVDPNSGYSRQVVHIDKEHYRLWKIEFYDRKNSLLKVLTISNYKQYLNKFWRAGSMLMENVQTGKNTTLNWNNYLFKTGLQLNKFQSAQLPRIR